MAIFFYCDTARPEHIERFRREKIKARYADKAVIAGIEVISRLFKLNKIFIIKEKLVCLKKKYTTMFGKIMQTNQLN